MKDHTLQKLYPHTEGNRCQDPQALELYLKEEIPTGDSGGTPFVYANFVTSLDGRIALPDQLSSSKPESFSTPEHMTTELDWTLFEQLQSHASALVTHSGYLRELELGRLGNALQIAEHSDGSNLKARRSDLGLAPEPTVIILSRSLDFRLPDTLDTNLQPTIVLTNAGASESRISELRDNNVIVEVLTHTGWITAADVMSVLKAWKLPNLYLQTGPDLLHSMLAHGMLNRLYLTTDISLTSGNPFVSMLNGDALDPPTTLKLRTMYLSSRQDEQSGIRQQLFSSYDIQNQ